MTEDEYRSLLVRIANAAGIDDPLQLIARAKNDEQTYGDLLFEAIVELRAKAEGSR